jgi:hypothetical protein
MAERLECPAAVAASKGPRRAPQPWQCQAPWMRLTPVRRVAIAALVSGGVGEAADGGFGLCPPRTTAVRDFKKG